MQALDESTRQPERNPISTFLIAGAAFFLMIWIQSRRPLWYDEIITLYVSRLPDMSTIWKAMSDGVDFNPPLFYLATRLATALFGEGENVIRLPGMIGYFVLCAGLYTVVARRFGSGYGLAAFLLPLSFGSSYYATEARAYGLVLGFTGLAVVGWDFARAGIWRRTSLAVMSLGLTGALLTHCYSVMVLFPFGLVWLVRIWRTRARGTFDLPYILAVLLPLASIASYFPLLAAIRLFAVHNPLFTPGWESVFDFYFFLLLPATLILAGWFAVVAFLASRGSKKDTPKVATTAADAELWTLAIGFLLIPVFVTLLATFFTHVIMTRYSLAALIGVCLALPLISVRALGENHDAGSWLGVTVAVLLFAQMLFGLYRQSVLVAAADGSVALESRRKDLPLVLGSGLLYIEMDYRQPPSNTARMTYLVDEQFARQHSGTDIFDKSFPTMVRWFPFRTRLTPYRQFTRERSRFLVLEIRNHPLNWLSSKLRADGYSFELVESSGRLALYEVNSFGSLPN